MPLDLDALETSFDAVAPHGDELMDRFYARLFTVAPDEDVREAARQMLYAEIHRLFVAEGDQVIGVISTMDIVRAVATGGL